MSSTETKPRGLIPISIATLIPNAILGIDVFVRAAPGLPATKLIESYEPVDQDRLKQYSDAGVKSAFIHADDQTRYQDYLNHYWDSILDDQLTPLPNRLRIMGEVVRGVANKEFQGNDTQQIIAASANLAHTAVQLISGNEIALDQLCEVLHHDYGTFTHSTNVSLYCILLAKKLGYSIEAQEEIAVGGMLHDLGKLEIDTKILNKPGKLNSHELKVMKQHPTIAFKRLVERDDITFGQLMMAYQHHERIDGKGYPCSIPGDQIHPYAKICAVVDVFEALTSERPYRLAMDKNAATRITAEDSGTHFDPELAAAWIELVHEGGTCNV